MTIITDYGTLQANHPTFQNIMAVLEDGPMQNAIIKYDYNTCCVQLSVALNQSQLKIENYDYFHPWLPANKDPAKSNRVRALPDNKGNNYIFSVPDMKVYLNNKYFRAENYQRPYKKPIMGRRGIIAFGNSHIDLWNGKEFHQEKIFGSWNAWDHSEAGGGIFFWEILSPANIFDDVFQ